MNSPDFLTRLREKNTEKCAKDELHKPSKGFTHFTQFPVSAKKADFQGGALLEKVGAGDTVVMTPAEESAIRGWLALIEETDRVIIADVLERCQSDIEARNYFLSRSKEGDAPSLNQSNRQHPKPRNSRERILPANPGQALMSKGAATQS